LQALPLSVAVPMHCEGGLSPALNVFAIDREADWLSTFSDGFSVSSV
jgi:hypothetical protein